MTQEINLEGKIEEISKGVVKFQSQAAGLVINDKGSELKATSLLSIVKGGIKRIEELKEFFVRPLKDQTKKIEGLFNEKLRPLLKIEKDIKELMKDYTLKQRAKVREENERQLKLKEARDARAKKAGKPIDLTPAPTVAKPETMVETEEGRITKKSHWTFKLIDEKKIPREYLKVDDKMIRKAIAKGIKEIDGVCIYEDVIINSTSFK